MSYLCSAITLSFAPMCPAQPLFSNCLVFSRSIFLHSMSHIYIHNKNLTKKKKSVQYSVYIYKQVTTSKLYCFIKKLSEKFLSYFNYMTGWDLNLHLLLRASQ